MPICILCTEKTHTKEHVFPAAMGGRRESKKIYCENHNNMLGALVVVLQQQLMFANAQIGVRGDRDKVARAALLTDKNNQAYEYLRGQFTVRPPDKVDELEVLENGIRRVSGSNLAQIEKWIAQQKRLGNDFKIVGEHQTVKELHTEPVELSQTFGGPEMFRSIAYIALTHLADQFPDLARHGGLEPFKKYLLASGAEPDNYIWWDDTDVVARLGEGPYPFGHVFVLGVSEKTGRAYGLVALFGAFSFGLDFGPVPGEAARERIVYVDPLAEWAMEDVDRQEVDLHEPQFAPAFMEFTAAVRDTLNARYEQFLKKADQWLTTSDAQRIYDAIVVIDAKDEDGRLAVILSALAPFEKRVIAVLLTTIQELVSLFDESEQTYFIRDVVAEMIPADRSPAWVLNLMPVAMHAISREIERLRAAGVLDVDSIAMLINGGRGVALLTTEVVLPAANRTLIERGDEHGELLQAIVDSFQRHAWNWGVTKH